MRVCLHVQSQVVLRKKRRRSQNTTSIQARRYDGLIKNDRKKQSRITVRPDENTFLDECWLVSDSGGAGRVRQHRQNSMMTHEMRRITIPTAILVIVPVGSLAAWKGWNRSGSPLFCGTYVGENKYLAEAGKMKNRSTKSGKDPREDQDAHRNRRAEIQKTGKEEQTQRRIQLACTRDRVLGARCLSDSTRVDISQDGTSSGRYGVGACGTISEGIGDKERSCHSVEHKPEAKDCTRAGRDRERTRMCGRMIPFESKGEPLRTEVGHEEKPIIERGSKTHERTQCPDWIIPGPSWEPSRFQSQDRLNFTAFHMFMGAALPGSGHRRSEDAGLLWEWWAEVKRN
ncbi:hypothetical protein C8J57DRAFT_1230032 [Mycena rebaudengoi]|nr:hypothetical protein C8J57DRAFT_1230032 [Mycena rebaudengoi]